MKDAPGRSGPGRSASAARPRRGLRLPRLRLLPLTIFAATLVLSVKLGGLYEGVLDGGAFSLTTPTVEVTQARAQQDAPPPPAGIGEGPRQLDMPPALPAARPPDFRDPTELTQAEIDVLQQLAQRREEIERRSRELENREGLLAAAEERINTKIAELQALQTTIEERLQMVDEQEERELESLVRIYETMKPKDAARIMNQLDMVVLMRVIERMRPNRVAPIMAEMDNERARMVTAELADRGRVIPGQNAPGAGGGG